jgi:DNA-binding NarL/FixJ family response regulator
VIRILVADDDALSRLGVRATLDAEPDLGVVAEASDGVEAVEAARAQPVDVALVDVQMPRLDGVEAARQLRRLPAPPAVLMLTAFNVTRNVVAAVEAGASGFLLKDATRNQIVAAVRSVAAGDPVLDPRSVRALFDQLEGPRRERERAAARLAALTDRERDVLVQVADGRTNAEIAGAVFLSEATVKAVVSQVLDRLGVENRTQAAILAHRAGLVA